MKYILFTLTCCILGPELSSAREYLGIDVDSLQQIQHNKDTVPARRHTQDKNNVLKTKKFLKAAIKTLQSYKDDELRTLIKNFKNSLTNMKADDKVVREAKKFVLNNMLSLTNGKSGKQIKQLLDIMYQALENDAYKNVLGHHPAIFEQLMSKLLKGVERNRAEDSDIIEIIKTALQKNMIDLMLNQNTVVKFAKIILKPESAENTDYFDEDDPRKINKSIQWFKDEAVKFVLRLLNNAKPHVEGQIDIQMNGMDEDSGLKFSFR